MVCSATSDPFSDWLDVTCSPDSSFLDAVALFFDSLLCPVAYSDADRTVLQVGNGKLVLDRKKRYHRASASGEVLAYLRACGEFRNYLSVLASVPHKVTRLDIAVDVSEDAPGVLRALESRYPADYVSLSRKALRVTRLYSARQSDGQLTGTWYVGHRSSARVTARVYDKQAQLLETQGLSIPPRTRFELTFRKDLGCTLRDAVMPASLFYQYAAPTLLDAPTGVGEWEPNQDCFWESVPVESLPFPVFLRRVETSPELARLAELAVEFGDTGRATVLRVFREHLDRLSKPTQPENVEAHGRRA